MEERFAMRARGMKALPHALVGFEPVTSFPQNVIGDVRRDDSLDVQVCAVGVSFGYLGGDVRRYDFRWHVHRRRARATQPMERGFVDMGRTFTDGAEEKDCEIGW